MQRRNQIIFTSSRASSRRCWPHTLLYRSGPRKDSREKKKEAKEHYPRRCVQETAVEIWSETLSVE